MLHAAPLPRTAAFMLRPHVVRRRATPQAVAAGMLLLPSGRVEASPPRRARLRGAVAQVLETPHGTARLKAAAQICGADWSDRQRVELLQALARLPKERCAALPAVQGMLAKSRWASPARSLDWALQAEASGQLPVWAAHGILPRLEGCEAAPRIVALLRKVPGAHMAAFWARVDMLFRGSREVASLPLGAAVEVCARLNAAHVGALLRALAQAKRPALAPIALTMGLRPDAVAPLGAALHTLASPQGQGEEPEAVWALAQAAQNDPQGLVGRVAAAKALRLDVGCDAAPALVALCKVPAHRWDAWVARARTHRVGMVASHRTRLQAIETLATREHSGWGAWRDAQAALARCLGVASP